MRSGYARKESYIGQDSTDLFSDTLQLHLNVNGKNITSLSHGNINIVPHGQGNVSLGNFTFDADSTVDTTKDGYALVYTHSNQTVKLEPVASGVAVQDEGSTLSTSASTINFVGNGVVASGTGATKTVTITDTTYSVQDGQLSQNNFTNADHSKLDGIAASANNYTHPNHSGEVTSTNDGAQVVADDIIDEANLKVSNTPTNDYVLTANSSASGGLTWAYPTLAGYAVSVVSSMPSSPDSNTIYFVT